jgi:hypothetical protein
MLNIITQIINFIFSFFTSSKIEEIFDNSEAQFIETDSTHQISGTIPSNWILFKEQVEEAFIFAENTRSCYYRGKAKWENQKGGNFSLIYRRGKTNLFVKINRRFHTAGKKAGLMEIVDIEETSKAVYNSCTALDNWYLQTYCNMLASVYSVFCCGFSLAYYKGDNNKYQWYNASKLYDMLLTGGYDKEYLYFKEIDFKYAQKYAMAGGLVYACWDNKKQTAHIATLTKNNTISNAEKDIQVHNAGGKWSRELKDFMDNYGVMSLIEAFGKEPFYKKEIKYFACFQK